MSIIIHLQGPRLNIEEQMRKRLKHELMLLAASSSQDDLSKGKLVINVFPFFAQRQLTSAWR